MTGAEFRAIRQKLGLTLNEWALALGYGRGNRNTRQVTVRKYEAGEREIPPWIERLTLMYQRHGVPDRFLAE